MLGMGSNREMDQGTEEEKECPPFPSSQSPIKFTLLCSLIFWGCLPCLVPRPHFSSQPKRFGSRGPCENVRPFPARSPQIRHRNKLTERPYRDQATVYPDICFFLHWGAWSWTYCTMSWQLNPGICLLEYTGFLLFDWLHEQLRKGKPNSVFELTSQLQFSMVCTLSNDVKMLTTQVEPQVTGEWFHCNKIRIIWGCKMQTWPKV